MMHTTISRRNKIQTLVPKRYCGSNRTRGIKKRVQKRKETFFETVILASYLNFISKMASADEEFVDYDDEEEQQETKADEKDTKK
jgi:hypothetical protein